MLHPKAKVGGGDVNELERSITRVKSLLFKQMCLCTRAMEDRHDRLSMLYHVAVQLHHFPLLTRAKQENGHSGGVGVPNFTPSGSCLAGELTDGHVWNHGGYTHGGTVGEEAVPSFYPAGEGICSDKVSRQRQFGKVDHPASCPPQGVV